MSNNTNVWRLREETNHSTMVFQRFWVCADLEKSPSINANSSIHGIYPSNVYTMSLISHFHISVSSFYKEEMNTFTWKLGFLGRPADAWSILNWKTKPINMETHYFLRKSKLNMNIKKKTFWLDFKFLKAETTVTISFTPKHLAEWP